MPNWEQVSWANGKREWIIWREPRLGPQGRPADKADVPDLATTTAKPSGVSNTTETKIKKGANKIPK